LNFYKRFEQFRPSMKEGGTPTLYDMKQFTSLMRSKLKSA